MVTTVLVDLPLSGTDGSTSFPDASGRTWTATGNAQIQSNRLLCDGTGDWIATPFDDGLLLYDRNFRIELRITTTDSSCCLIDSEQGRVTNGETWMLSLTAGGLVQWYDTNYGGLNGVTVVNDGLEHLIAVERNGNLFSIFVDGVLDSSVTRTNVYFLRSPASVAIGARVNNRTPSQDFAGSIRNVKITREDVGVVDAQTFMPYQVQPVGWNNTITRFDTRVMIVVPPPPPPQWKVFPGLRIHRAVPSWWGIADYTTLTATYELRGQVLQHIEETDEDVPLPNTRVALFFRRTYAVIDMKVSDENGYVTFENLMPGNQAYFAIAFDPEGSPMQNSILWDRLTSVPGD